MLPALWRPAGGRLILEAPSKVPNLLFERCQIPDLVKITPKIHGDVRGQFVELFRVDMFQPYIGDVTLVQHNQSLSRPAGTVRGLHYQVAPAAQGKLVRCASGAIFDVAVDIRRSSPTFGQHVSVELSAEAANQLWIPPGFAHGFCTLTPDVEVWYAVTHVYSPENERGILWNDPDLGIDWPVAADAATLAPRDMKQPRFSEYEADFA